MAEPVAVPSNAPRDAFRNVDLSVSSSLPRWSHFSGMVLFRTSPRRDRQGRRLPADDSNPFEEYSSLWG